MIFGRYCSMLMHEHTRVGVHGCTCVCVSECVRVVRLSVCVRPGESVCLGKTVEKILSSERMLSFSSRVGVCVCVCVCVCVFLSCSVHTVLATSLVKLSRRCTHPPAH